MMLECVQIAAARMARGNLDLANGAQERFVSFASAFGETELGRNLLEHDPKAYEQMSKLVEDGCERLRAEAEWWTDFGDKIGTFVVKAGAAE